MRASLRILARDLRRLVKSPVALIVTLGVCLIPSAYAWLNVLANWDPYENTGTVPVAVVVEDEGADVPGLGPVNAGALIRERLEENHQLGWEFVDEATALEGVRSGRYYAAFVIPADFTGTLAGVMEGDARAGRIAYYVNEKVNAVSPKVTDTGATTLERQVAGEFVSVAGEAVTERVQDALREQGEARGTAASGALETLRGTARTLGDLRGDRAEELRYGLLLLQVRKYDAARVGRVLLRFGYQRLHEHAYGLGFGERRLDALVQNQRRGHVRKHCLAVSRLTAEVVEILIVSHN